MRSIVEPLLAFFARRIVRKYRPTIIGITGSVGKTSTRAAVFSVVLEKYRAYTPPKNLNDKIGLPLGIIGMDTPGRSLLGWLRIFARALFLLAARQQYPEVLVLEYGIDRVGEMDDLLAVAKPNIAILTSIGLSHYQFFQDQKTIEQEKSKILQVLDSTDFAIINADDDSAAKQESKTRARVITYGHAGLVRPTNIQETLANPAFMELQVVTPSRHVSAAVAALGVTHVSSCLAAVAVAEALGVETDLVQKGLATYKPAPGRLNVIGGIRKSVLIDDTYNGADPAAMYEALRLFARFPGSHKIAVLGDMLELGDLSDEAHTAVGKEVAAISPTHLVTVGPGGRIIAEGARGGGFSEERIISFNTSQDAMVPVQELMREGSVVLLKGSQSMRMEKITKEIMAEPMRAGELLCRQYGKWLRT